MYLTKAQVRVLRIVATFGVAVAADFAGLPGRWRQTALSLVRHGFLKSVGSGFMLTERGAAQVFSPLTYRDLVLGKRTVLTPPLP